MTKFFLIIFSFISISGCLNHYKGIQLSQLTINSKKANSLIVERIPDYGDGHKDGCIVMSEMRLNLTVNKTGLTSGQVTDVSTGAPLHNAQVKLKDNLRQTYVSLSDSSGQFTTNIAEKLTDLQIDYIGYRRLAIKF